MYGICQGTAALDNAMIAKDVQVRWQPVAPPTPDAARPVRWIRGFIAPREPIPGRHGAMDLRFHQGKRV